MSTSLAAALRGDRLLDLASSRRWETAEGVAVGAVVGGIVLYLLQHYIKFQRSTVSGRVQQWCPNQPLSLVGGGFVDIVGTSGSGAGAVFSTPIGADGHFAVTLPPGLYMVAVHLADGHQVPAMVLTPQTASGQIPVTSALELIFDVWSQVLVPQSTAVTVELLVNC